MSKILITGVAGLLGSHISRYFLDKGHTVIGIDNLSGGYKDFVDCRVIFFDIDLLSSKLIDCIFDEHKPDYVFHFAAYAAEGLSPFMRNYNYTNNVICSVNVINLSIKYNVKKLIFTSSMAVYGFGNPPFTENQQPKPEDPYGLAKYVIEQDLYLAYKQFGLNYTIIRPHNVLGIYQNIWDKYRNVIGIWIRKTLQKEPILIYGDGLQTRSFSDIKYYCEPFEKVMYNYNAEIFNLGADRHYQLLDIADLVKQIGKKYSYDTEILHVEQRNEVKHAYCDQTKAKQILGLNDNTDIEKLIDSVFTWAMTQPNRQVIKLDYEIKKYIYSFWK